MRDAFVISADPDTLILAHNNSADFVICKPVFLGKVLPRNSIVTVHTSFPVIFEAVSADHDIQRQLTGSIWERSPNQAILFLLTAIVVIVAG